MTRLSWDRPIDPAFERGVDRALVKIKSASSVQVWNGLLSVEETSIGGERSDSTYDSIKYYETISTKNWQAMIRAFTYPEDFYLALGMTYIKSGFYLARQPRSEFFFSYRTKVGVKDYKIHFVYNATILPAQPARKTVSDVPDPDIFEWTINAVPDRSLSGIKPTAHFVVETAKTDPAAIAALEDVLYGTSTTPPSFPTASELVALVNG